MLLYLMCYLNVGMFVGSTGGGQGQLLCLDITSLVYDIKLLYFLILEYFMSYN